MVLPLSQFISFTSLISFIIGLPTIAATYYQAFKARQEASQAREGAVIHSENCLEFVYDDGGCVNLVPLETLHTLPRPGDIVLLPGDGTTAGSDFHTGAYRIDRVEHIYSRVDQRSSRPREARLTKVAAHVSSLHE